MEAEKNDVLFVCRLTSDNSEINEWQRASLVLQRKLLKLNDSRKIWYTCNFSTLLKNMARQQANGTDLIINLAPVRKKIMDKRVSLEHYINRLNQYKVIYKYQPNIRIHIVSAASNRIMHESVIKKEILPHVYGYHSIYKLNSDGFLPKLETIFEQIALHTDQYNGTFSY